MTSFSSLVGIQSDRAFCLNSCLKLEKWYLVVMMVELRYEGKGPVDIFLQIGNLEP